MTTITKNELIIQIEKGEMSWRKWRDNSQNETLICDNSVISSMDLDQFQFYNIQFKNTKFIDCSLQNTRFDDCELDNCAFNNCDFQNVVFNNLNAKKISLCTSKGNGLKFTNSILEDCTLFESEIKPIEFIQSSFLNIDMSRKNSLLISFSSIQVDNKTIRKARKNPKITVGLNGIYNQVNNSASLISESPKGDEMTGGKEEVILNSLIKAKRAFVMSVSITLIIMAIKFIGINSFAYVGLKINPKTFSLYALPIIFFSLYKCNVLLGDVVTNVKYINTQSGAMTIGKYPWLLSRFSGNKVCQKAESLIIRILYCAHPLLFLSILIPLSNQQTFKETILNLEIAESIRNSYINGFPFFITILWILLFSIVLLTVKVFYKSQKLQKPLLFDLENPIKHVNDLNKISISLNHILNYILQINFKERDWEKLKNYITKKSELVEKELKKK